MDAKLESVLMDHQAAYAEAEAYNDWMPPDGEYLVSVKSVKEGTTTDGETGKVHVWIKIVGTIQGDPNPELNGCDFSLGYSTTKNLSSMKTLLNELTGEQIQNVVDAIKASHGKVGHLFQVKVSTTYSKKYEREFKNAKILSEVSAAVDEPKTSPEVSVN